MMKTHVYKLVFLLTLLLSINSNAQDSIYTEGYVKTIHAIGISEFKEDSLMYNTQKSTYIDSIASLHIPNDATTIKYIKLNFHFYLHSTLGGNFDSIDDNYANTTEPYSAYNFVDDVVEMMNHYFSNLEVHNYQLSCCPLAFIPDSKIRVYNAGVYFHYNNANLIYGNYPSDFINGDSIINVFFFQKNYNTGVTGNATFNLPRYISINGAWEMYKAHQDLFFADTTESTFWKNFTKGFYGSTLDHELLHDLGLLHATVAGNDDLSDTPSIKEIEAEYGIEYDCYNNRPSCTNNFMDYGGGKALTPLQLGKAHYYTINVIPQYIDWSKSANADLYIRDSPIDDGTVPSTEVTCWNSPNIWIEKMNGDTLSNPVGGEPCFVNVRIHNKNFHQSSGNNEVLSLYWSKAGVDLRWPIDWNGSTNFSCGKKRGSFIGSVTIPVIQPQGEITLKILWTPPIPQEYENCTEFGDDKWHFCLAATIDQGNDPLTTNTPSMWYMTVLDNNFAWKNLTIDNSAVSLSVPGGIVSFSKPLKYNGTLNLKFNAKKSKEQGYITDVAEVRLKLSQGLYKAWSDGGKRGIGIKDMGRNEIMINNINAEISNIYLNDNQNEFILTQTYFLTQKPSPTNTFEFNLFETFDNNEIIGGETYIITKNLDGLKAVTSEDKIIVKGEETEIKSLNTESNASYLWYNNEQIIDSNLSVFISPENTTNYVLEIIKNESGNKDYDTVNVIVKKAIINSITPNPASNIITINYRLSNSITSAYIKIKNIYGLVLINVPINMLLSEKQIYLNSLSAGMYLLELISNDEILDCKTIIKKIAL